MKTIAITDSAYERLAMWKVAADEGFSDVILRTVPLRGSMEAVMAAAGRHLPPLNPEAEKELVAEFENGRRPAGDAWQ